MPHGAKSYLAAALALVAGERICWVARDSEIGDRVAEELAAWVGDPAAVVVLEPRTALAYERSELVADETAARVAALAAWRTGRARILVASVQALIQHTIAPGDLPEQPAGARGRGAGRPGHAPARAARARLRAGARGRGPWRVRAPRRHRRRLPAVGRAAGPDRIVRRRDRFAPGVRPDRPAHDREGRARHAAARVGVPRAGGRRGGPRGAARARLSKRLPERLAQDLERLLGTREPGGGSGESRAAAVGDAAEIWAPLLAPATALDHLAPDDPVRHRRARRHRRGRRVPVAPGRRAARGPPRVERAAEGLAARRSSRRETGSAACSARAPWS